MGVVVHRLKMGTTCQIRIGRSTHVIGVIGRLWKLTDTGLRERRADQMDRMYEAERRRRLPTPKAVMVEGPSQLGPGLSLRAHLVLGWDEGRLKTQDYDWDHLPTLGYAKPGPDGDLVLHELVGDHLAPMTEARAKQLDILDKHGELVRRGQPTIVDCRSVESMGGTYYSADCEFSDGRSGTVVGESESGDLPAAEWLVGRTPESAGKYRLASQVAFLRSSPPRT